MTQILRKEYVVKQLYSAEKNASKNWLDIPWNKAEVLEGFVSPWCKSDFSKTKFRALHDGKFLFFRFDVEDNAIYCNKKNNNYENIGASDRVEIFFRKDKNLDPYYCMEIDSSARIMDFKARPNKDFDFSWNFTPTNLEVNAVITETGYTVKGKLRIKFLESLQLIKDGLIETGIYQAKYIKQKSNYEPIWKTWVDPNTKTPDFHVPTSFGLLKLEAY